MFQPAPQAVIPVLLALLPLVVFLVWAKIKGKLGNFSANAGSALMQSHMLARPTVQHIVEAKKQRKKENSQDDDGPPDLPPWAKAE